MCWYQTELQQLLLLLWMEVGPEPLSCQTWDSCPPDCSNEYSKGGEAVGRHQLLGYAAGPPFSLL